MQQMDAPNEPPVDNPLPNGNRGRNRPDLTDTVRNRIVTFFLENCSIVDGVHVPARGTTVAAANFFNIDRTTAAKIWKNASDNRNDPSVGYYTSIVQRKGRCGPKVKYDPIELEEALVDLPKENRKTIRGVSAGLGVSTNTVQRMLKTKNIKRNSNQLLPILSEEIKTIRLWYAAAQVGRNEDGSYSDYFHGSYDEIHIDEKWFEISEQVATYYMGSEEPVPNRSVQNKGHLIKVMFLVAVARPRFDELGEVTFDGKIGCWPFIERRAAQRDSVNRPRGTIVTKPLNVTKMIYKRFIFEKLLPAINQNWPRGNIREIQSIKIQQDNAPVHFLNDDVDWQQAINPYRHRFAFKIKEQPAKSPDTNILDLGFFAALQAHYHKLPAAYKIDKLIRNVKRAWRRYDPKSLNRTFLTHQSICDEIMKHNGDNTYTIPHLGKEALERRGALPVVLPVSQASKNLLAVLH